MSSPHQPKDGTTYPAIMAINGVNDVREDVWQSAKFVSRAMQASTGGKPVLMQLECGSGHGPIRRSSASGLTKSVFIITK